MSLVYVSATTLSMCSVVAATCFLPARVSMVSLFLATSPVISLVSAVVFLAMTSMPSFKEA